MQPGCMFNLCACLVLVVAAGCVMHCVDAAETSPAAESGAAAQPQPAAAAETGIVISPAIEKPKTARKLEEKDMAGYLLVYFKDQTHSAYFAISRDGYSFTDVNGGRPIFDGKLLAEQKGVRDPHIARGPDGAFYLSMTDLHISAQRAGFRTTQWERPQEQYGWGNNRALVLMKSWDLIHWTHSDFRVDKAFPDIGDIGCTWAPETIFDEAKGRLMVYFSMRFGAGLDQVYYSYADDAFTKLETKPELLFKYTAEVHTVDGDITKVGDKFHLYYAAEDTGRGSIKHAVSDKINQGYVHDPKKVDPENVPCEAPNLFKRLGTDTYVLMYDAFGAGNMGFSETTDFVTYKNIGRFNQGAMKTTNFTAPKHGAVVHLTLDELKSLAKYWKMDVKLD
jgi:hypothetical protein